MLDHTRNAIARLRMAARLAGFARREDGTVTIFSLLMFVLMVGVGGIAIDVMRYETQRVQLQYTLDRAILAAAALNQSQDPEAVVRDYFARSGLTDFRLRVTPDEGLNYRRVTAQAEMDMNPMFMHMFGVRSLTSPAFGSAEERVDNVEISLVLDISGSMRSHNRLPNLQDAAVAFNEIVLDGPLNDRISINLIPYAGHVNPGPTMFDIMGGQRRHANNSCIEFDVADFRSDDLPSGTYEQVPHFMMWNIAWSWMDWGWCPEDDTSILYAENRLNVLNDFIRGIRLHDGTGTHIGMKYGLALLNPDSRPVFGQLVSAGIINNEDFNTRPADWDDQETAKFIILMTDGQITEQMRPREWDHAQNPTVELARRPSSERMTRTPGVENFNRFRDICEVAADRNVTVFTIAFEVPAGTARTAMRDCASSPSHFYNVDGIEINDAFRSIANTINRLRLTQ